MPIKKISVEYDYKLTATDSLISKMSDICAAKAIPMTPIAKTARA